MKLRINNKYFKWGATAFFVIAAGIGFYYLVFHISDILRNLKALSGIVMPVIFGLIIAYLLTPILNFLERKILNPLFDLCKWKPSIKRKRVVRALAVLLTSGFMIFVIYALIAMLVSQIVPSMRTIVNNFDNYVSELSRWLNKLLDDNQDLKNIILPQVTKISTEIETWLTDTTTLFDKSTEVLKTVSLSIMSFLKGIWNFVIGFIISIYVLFSKETFTAQGKKMVYAIFESRSANTMLRFMRFVHRTFIGFVSGKILDSAIIGVLCFIGTSIMKTPYAVLVSVIVGVTNMIPFFGPYLGAIPSALLILIVDLRHPLNCVYFILFILILQQVDGNLIGPRILGGSTGLSGFWVIFSITVFGGLFGIPGMIVGVPIFAVIFATIKGLIHRSLNKKKMPIESNLYLNLEAVDDNGNFLAMEEKGQRKENNTSGGAIRKITSMFRKVSKNADEKSKDKQNEE